jgi:hypothetical protein
MLRWLGGLALALGLAWALTAQSPAPVAAQAPAYLALGDSVPFGYDPNKSPWPETNFVGYPNLLAQSDGYALSNPSCPGETTQHYLGQPNAPDNGCGLIGSSSRSTSGTGAPRPTTPTGTSA